MSKQPEYSPKLLEQAASMRLTGEHKYDAQRGNALKPEPSEFTKDSHSSIEAAY